MASGECQDDCTGSFVPSGDSLPRKGRGEEKKKNERKKAHVGSIVCIVRMPEDLGQHYGLYLAYYVPKEQSIWRKKSSPDARKRAACAISSGIPNLYAWRLCLSAHRIPTTQAGCA